MTAEEMRGIVERHRAEVDGDDYADEGPASARLDPAMLRP